MKRHLFSLTLLATALFASPHTTLAAGIPTLETVVVHASTAAIPDPAAQMLELADRFRANDLNSLARSMMPASKWQELLSAYELARSKPISEHDRAEFNKVFGRLLAVDAVDQILAEVEPQLAEARAQLPGFRLMALGGIQLAINREDSDLSASQRETLRQVFPGLQDWIIGTDFLAEDTLRDALTLIADAVRHSGISSLDDLKAMPLESALDRGSEVLAAAKNAVRLYGIDLDAIAASMRVEVLKIDGDTATVRTQFTVFNTVIPIEHELVLREGRWYGKQAAIEFDQDQNSNAADLAKAEAG